MTPRHVFAVQNTLICHKQGGRWHWTVSYYYGTQNFSIKPFHFLTKTLDTFIKLDWLIQTSSVQTFEPIRTIHWMGYFFYHHWGLKSMYCPLSYPSISLVIYALQYTKMSLFKTNRVFEKNNLFSNKMILLTNSSNDISILFREDLSRLFCLFLAGEGRGKLTNFVRNIPKNIASVKKNNFPNLIWNSLKPEVDY